MHSSTPTARLPPAGLPPAQLELEIRSGMGLDPGLPTLVNHICCEDNLNSNNLHSDVSSHLEKEILLHLTLININKKNTVVNLSSRNLSSDEESLLSKGLNFCPTPGEPLLAQKHDDLEYFHNNLRWKLFFSNNNPIVLRFRPVLYIFI